MTTFDLISNFILSAILSGYIISQKTSWFGFSFVIFIYFIINYLINVIGHTNWGRKLIIGTPTIIIEGGVINKKNLKKMNMNMTDFMSLLRTQDVNSLKDVKLAQIEIGGNLTVVRKGEDAFAILLIEDGKVNTQNLKHIKKSQKWLSEQLKKKKINSPSDVFYAQWQNGEFYAIQK